MFLYLYFYREVLFSNFPDLRESHVVWNKTGELLDSMNENKCVGAVITESKYCFRSLVFSTHSMMIRIFIDDFIYYTKDNGIHCDKVRFDIQLLNPYSIKVCASYV